MKDWEKLQEWVCEQLREIDSTLKQTPGSGNGNKKGDIFGKSNIGLHVECKCYNKKNVWEIDWLEKCESEIPLHSDKIAIVVSENKEDKKVVHLDAEDFFEMYKKLWRLENE